MVINHISEGSCVSRGKNTAEFYDDNICIFFAGIWVETIELTLYSTETIFFLNCPPPSKIETYDIKIPWAGEPVPRGKQCFKKLLFSYNVKLQGIKPHSDQTMQTKVKNCYHHTIQQCSNQNK